MTVQTDRLASLFEPVVNEFGFDLESVDIKHPLQRTTVIVAIDGDEGVTIDDITDVSRALSVVLDSEDPMGEQSYNLEVASRGAGAPLTLPRHWRRNTGRLVKVKRGLGQTLTGRIGESDDTGVTVDGERIAYADISKAVVQIEFTREES